MADFSWPKFCTKCGRPIRSSSWQRLPRVGEMGVSEEKMIELRNCPCGSTIAVPAKVARALPTE